MDGDARIEEPLVALVVRDLVDDRRAIGRDTREVDAQLSADRPCGKREAGVVHDLGDVDQGLRWDAPVEGAVTADPALALDERDARPFVPSCERGREARGTAAEHDDVVAGGGRRIRSYRHISPIDRGSVSFDAAPDRRGSRAMRSDPGARGVKRRMPSNSRDQPRRTELAEWYLELLRPKVAAAAQAGTIHLAALIALDQLIEPLLPPSAVASGRLPSPRFAA